MLSFGVRELPLKLGKLQVNLLLHSSPKINHLLLMPLGVLLHAIPLSRHLMAEGRLALLGICEVGGVALLQRSVPAFSAQGSIRSLPKAMLRIVDLLLLRIKFSIQSVDACLLNRTNWARRRHALMMSTRPPLGFSQLGAQPEHDLVVSTARLGFGAGDSVSTQTLRFNLRSTGRRSSRLVRHARLMLESGSVMRTCLHQLLLGSGTGFGLLHSSMVFGLGYALGLADLGAQVLMHAVRVV